MSTPSFFFADELQCWIKLTLYREEGERGGGWWMELDPSIVSLIQTENYAFAGKHGTRTREIIFVLAN